ncbi:MAG TPA: YceI family protein [Pseudobdellovibrionaceae bacterium]|nr:YceI family protein [Pseudobdellovibrionaceae bacterium]
MFKILRKNVNKFFSTLSIFTTVFILFTSSAFANKSQVKIFVSLSPAGSFTATTSEISGAVSKLSDGSFEAKNISVQLKKLKSGMTLRDEHMTKKYLETDKYPEALLISATGKNEKGEGLVKIKGIEKKIQGSFQVLGSNLKATFNLKPSDFEIKGIRYMGVGVKDQIRVEILLPINK